MKTVVGKLLCFAALGALAMPLGSSAQNIVSPPATAHRGDLTLLPGPSLLSPARGAPQSTPNIAIEPARLDRGSQEQFRFVPTTPQRARKTDKAGTLTLQPSDSVHTGGMHAVPSEKRPAAETLRFDASLRTPAVPLKLEAVPAPTPRRD